MDCCSCIWRGAVWRRSMRAEVYCTTPIQKYSTDGCDRSIEGQRRKPANAGWTSDVTQAGRDAAYEIIKRTLGVL